MSLNIGLNLASNPNQNQNQPNDRERNEITIVKTESDDVASGVASKKASPKAGLPLVSASGNAGSNNNSSRRAAAAAKRVPQQLQQQQQQQAQPGAKATPAASSASVGGSLLLSRFALSIPHPVIAYGSYAVPGSLPASVMTSTSGSSSSSSGNVVNGSTHNSSDANCQSPTTGMRDSNNNGNGNGNGNASAASPSGSANASGDRLSRTNLYIRGLPATTSDQDLFTMCKHFGKITSTKSIVDPDGKCRGYGFVDFEHPEAAERALRELQKQNHQVQFARQQEQDPTNLYVQNLPITFSEAELERMFARYGAVVSTRILRSQNGVSKGVGFSRMESNEKCELVIRAYNGTFLPGAREALIVKFADGGQRKRMKQQQAAVAHAAATAAAQLNAAQIAQQQQLAALSAAALSPALVGDLSAYIRAQNIATLSLTNGYANAALLAANGPLAQLSRVGIGQITTPIFATGAQNAQTAGSTQQQQQQYAGMSVAAQPHGRAGQSSGGPGPGAGHQHQAGDQSHDGSMLQANGNGQAGAVAHQYYIHPGAQQVNSQATATLIPISTNENGIGQQQLQQLAIAMHNGQQYITAAQPSVTVANAFGGAVASTTFANQMNGPNALLHSVPLNVAGPASYYNEY